MSPFIRLVLIQRPVISSDSMFEVTERVYNARFFKILCFCDITLMAVLFALDRFYTSQMQVYFIVSKKGTRCLYMRGLIRRYISMP